MQQDTTVDEETHEEYAVEVSGLKKVYGGTVLAVDGIDFKIDQGDFCVIIGPSGCGKSTTLHSLVGKVTPTEGRIRINGEDVTNTPTHERNVGLVFQDFQLFPHMTVEENIRYGLERVGRDDEEAVEEMIELMDLASSREQSTTELSAGQRQRVALARSLVLRPDVLLLDEPLGDMDYKLQKRMENELLRIHREVETTFVYVTHDQRQAMRMGDQLIVMNEGRIEQSGSAQEIYDSPKNAFVAAFVGDSNIFKGTIAEADGAVVKTDVGSIRLNDRNTHEAGETAYFLIRPHLLSVTAGDAESENSLTGEVLDVIRHPVSGVRVFVEVGSDSAVQEVQAQVQELPETISAGDTVSLEWGPEDAHLLTELSVAPAVDIETDILGE